MEEQWYVDRVRLRECLAKHPEVSKRSLARELGHSEGWVKKWCKRLLAAGLDDDTALHSQSRIPRHPPERIHPEVVKRILDIRDHPPENLQRTPGPRAILYYLHRDEGLKATGLYLPKSASTVWAILDQHQRIVRKPKIEHCPVERPEPMACWQMDFKDVTTVKPSVDGKRLHVVETFNIIDTGSSLLLESMPAPDYTAESTLLAVAAALIVHGLPDKITFDRDPRFVGSWTGRDFPSALSRFLLCLGVEPDVCPPQRPDLNPFVERFHRAYEEECLQVHRPATLEQAVEVTGRYKQHYNFERPSQAATCKNQPPAFAFPDLPARPRPSDVVDTDRWLQTVHGKCYTRRVDANGSIEVSKRSYYVSKKLVGRYVVLRVNAHDKCFEVEVAGRPFKNLPIKGLHGMYLGFQSFVELMRLEAVAEWRLTQRKLQARLADRSHRPFNRAGLAYSVGNY